ncbi:MAG: Asp-tRNA(Asn)/Glu-tRNA(Gln) amidotransferase subunit GatC [bacterium]|nr:Asp-tRNA(Asn)/Glu-tRNA(Gln) amidotransferase subunit GatC [bacterium]
MIDRETVEKLAKLTRVEISEEEKDSMVADLEAILGYVSELSSSDTSSVVDTLDTHRNIFREDEGAEEPGIHTAKILADAPRTEDGYILVKQVIGEKGAVDSIR